jgi:hypothetical protein
MALGRRDLTKKHFELVAEALREAAARASGEAERNGVALVLAELKARLKSTNPRFDACRFERRATNR